MICSDKPTLAQSVKILDFGLAKIKSGELLGSFVQAKTTGLMGSPYYMAPEQWADEDSDSRSDIYSLGVMLYQMLAGDVPFKGSSIPAIMKKHISDAPPTLAAAGLIVSPELERAVLHSLQKNPEKRTESVEMFVNELREAIQPGTQFINTTQSGGTLPPFSLKITSKPPQSNVYIDNVAVGQTRENGLLLLEGLQSGNHQLRVSHAGFYDWLADVVCDGRPVEVLAELKAGAFDSKAAIPMPDVTVGGTHPTMVSPRLNTDDMAQTVQQSWSPSRYDVAVNTVPPKKKSFKALVFGIGGLLALFVIGIVGIGIAYQMGAFGGGTVPPGNIAGKATPTPAASPVPITADLASIPGGTFKMGRNDGGRENERPSNSVVVTAFKMDKTEVTNGEYYAFINETGYRPIPAHWVNDRPISGQEKMPVRFVNFEDAEAFARWRSKRDSVTYRLPTEAEWEYAARNGAKNSAYPWGDTFDSKCAVTDKETTEPDAVGTASCANDWGVLDLIGNVYEWTSSKASLYPGSRGSVKATKDVNYMIRGGAALTKSTGEFGITPTFRQDVDGSTRDKELGFRLVAGN